MVYNLNSDTVEKMAKEETVQRKKPLRISFVRRFIILAVVMVIGLLIGYISYVRLGIYSPKNLLCFMVGVALFSMGFMRMFEAIGKYIDDMDKIDSVNPIKGITLWRDSIFKTCNSASLTENEKGYILSHKRLVPFSGEEEATQIISPETVKYILTNKNMTQAAVSLNPIEQFVSAICIFPISDGMFKAEDGTDLKVKDFCIYLHNHGVDSIYVRDADFLISAQYADSFKMWTPDGDPFESLLDSQETPAEDTKTENTQSEEAQEEVAKEPVTETVSGDYKVEETESTENSEDIEEKTPEDTVKAEESESSKETDSPVSSEETTEKVELDSTASEEEKKDKE